MDDMSVNTSTGSTSVFTELSASLFQICRVEVVIESPAADVWAVLTDLSLETLQLWNPGLKSVKRISGEPGTGSECVLLTKNDRVMLTKEEGAAQAPFYMRAVRMVRPHQRVLRIDAVDASYGAFVDHSLYEFDRKTKLVYSGYIETRHVPAGQVKTFDDKKAAADMMEYLYHTHGLLKRAIEERVPAR